MRLAHSILRQRVVDFLTGDKIGARFRHVREPLVDPVRIRLATAPRLADIPAPAEQLRLSVERFGPPAGDQRPLLEDSAAAREARLREAVRQVRAVAGPDGALRILQVDPSSRLPERRALLTPFEG